MKMIDPNKLDHPLAVNPVTGEARLATETEIAEYESERNKDLVYTVINGKVVLAIRGMCK